MSCSEARSHLHEKKFFKKKNCGITPDELQATADQTRRDDKLHATPRTARPRRRTAAQTGKQRHVSSGRRQRDGVASVHHGGWLPNRCRTAPCEMPHRVPAETELHGTS